MKKSLAALVITATAPAAWSYDQARVEALRGGLTLAALCLEKYGDRETFEIVFDRLSVANSGNPDPTSRAELQGVRDGVISGAKSADLAKIDDRQLKPVCQKIRLDPDEW